MDADYENAIWKYGKMPEPCKSHSKHSNDFSSGRTMFKSDRRSIVRSVFDLSDNDYLELYKKHSSAVFQDILLEYNPLRNKNKLIEKKSREKIDNISEVNLKSEMDNYPDNTKIFDQAQKWSKIPRPRNDRRACRVVCSRHFIYSK